LNEGLVRCANFDTADLYDPNIRTNDPDFGEIMSLSHLHATFHLYAGETLHATSLQNDCPEKCLNQDFQDYWIFRILPLIATTYTISYAELTFPLLGGARGGFINGTNG